MQPSKNKPPWKLLRSNTRTTNTCTLELHPKTFHHWSGFGNNLPVLGHTQYSSCTKVPEEIKSHKISS